MQRVNCIYYGHGYCVLALAGLSWYKPRRFLLLLVLSVAIPIANAAKLNPTKQDILLSVPLYSENEVLGDIMMLIDTADNLSINKVHFFKIATEFIKPEYLSTLKKSSADSRFITADLLNSHGYDVSFDLSLLQLRLVWPVEQKLIGHINVDKSPLLMHRESLPRHLSAYVNLYGGLSRSGSGNDSALNHTLAAEGALSIPELGHATVESEFRLRNDEHLTREGSRVIINDVESSRIISVGDILTESFSFLSSNDLLGINISKNRNRYNTGLSQNAHTTGSRSFFLERNSIVRIYVNGDLKTTKHLASGPYQLDEFPIGYGHNQILVEIEDDTGIQNRLSFNFYSDNNFLPQGESEYSLGVGTRRQWTDNRTDYTSDPVMSAYYRNGLFSGTTVSGFSKLSENTSLLGIETLIAMSFGKLSIEAAVSRIKGLSALESGINVGTTVFLPRTTRGQSRRLFFGLGYNSELFNQDDALENNSYKYTGNLNYSQRISRHWNAGVIVRSSHYYDKSDEINTAFDLGYHKRNLSVRTGLSFQDSADEEDSPMLSLQLNYRFDRSQSLSFTRTGNELSNLGYRVNSSRKGVGAWNMGGNLSSNRGQGQNLDFDTHYTGNRAELGATHITGLSGDGQDSNSFSSLNIASAIAYVDGEMALGRPIRDSFSIFSTHDNLQKRSAYINKDQQGNFAAKTGLFGPALYSELQSYSNASQTYSVDDLPLGYNLDSGVDSVYPTYRSGFHKTIGSDATVTALGVLLDQNDQPVKLLAGQIQPVGESSILPIAIFTNSAGRFSAQGLSPGQWKLTLFDKHRELLYFLNIPESTVGLLRTGKIQLHKAQDTKVGN